MHKTCLVKTDLVESACQIDYDLACSVVVDDFKLANVT